MTRKGRQTERGPTYRLEQAQRVHEPQQRGGKGRCQQAGAGQSHEDVQQQEPVVQQ